MKCLNLSLGPDEGLLFVILLVRPTEDALGPRSILRLLLERSIVRVVETVSWHVELRRVPLLERTDELFLDHIDLLLAFSELHLAVLELLEVVPVDLLQVLHFAEQDQFLLVNDLLRLLFKHVVLPELFLPLANFPLFLLPIEALLECVDLSLVLVQGVGDALDLGPPLLDNGAVLSDVAFEGLPRGAGLELDERLLLVDGLPLLLDGLFELLVSGVRISITIRVVLFILSLGSSGRILALLGSSSVLLGALRRCSAQLILLELAEGFGVRGHLPLDRLNILLCLSILHTDD